MPIHVPPLRERKDDIAALVRHFADLFSRENNFRRKTFTAAAMERLRQHHWRGNIRELRNFVERLIIMSPRDQIDVKDMPDSPAPPRSTPATAAPPAGRRRPRRPPAAADTAGCSAPTLQEFKSSSERAYLVNKLRENGWNISKTAEVIDTPRSNLYKKLEQYQISQETDGRRGRCAPRAPSSGCRRRRRSPSQVAVISIMNRCSGRMTAAVRNRRRRRVGEVRAGEESPNSTGQCAG